MKYKVFVDGSEGTTGLQINDRLNSRNDLDILMIDPEKRKDPVERSKFLNSADIVFLCLPDPAAKESVSLITNPHTKVIDASTAHRTDPDWAYGLPELSSEHRNKIKNSSRVTVPGCYATGFISLIYPIVKSGLLPAHYPVTTFGISGYSGGGKKLIEKFEHNYTPDLESPQLYALGLAHKHIPEMTVITGLTNKPIFSPAVCNYYKGMTVSVPIHVRLLDKKLTKYDFHQQLSENYAGQKFIKVMPLDTETTYPNSFIGAKRLNDTNMLEIYVTGNDDMIMLISVLDNLGKGSSGAAIQNMNIMLGLDEGLSL